jgi:DNA-binding CsgD family transcriptional regulator
VTDGDKALPKKTKKVQAKASDPWSEVSAKLDILIRLSAINAVKDMKLQKEQIRTLSDAGFGPSEIADILDTTSNTVSVALTAIRKERTSTRVEEERKEQPINPTTETPAAEQGEMRTRGDASAGGQ